MGRRYWLVPLAVLGAALLYHRLRRDSGQRMAGSSLEFSGPMARVYDSLVSAPLDGFYARLARRLTADIPSGQALDVGCGPGRLALHMARQAPGLTVTGIDISPGMIDQANRRAKAWHLSERVRFQVADVGALPFPDDQFDLVVSTFSLHHWPDPARGLSEVRRVLKPAGKACMYDLADWILWLTRHGPRQAKIRADSHIASDVIEPVWSVGSVPLLTGFCLRR